jgi:hypothetical protein
MAKEFMETNYGTTTIYGDSVTGDTPLIIKFPDDTIDIITIECLTKEWIEYRGFKVNEKDIYNKEQSFIDAEVWADGKWAKIHRVIRHKCNKQIYRVNTLQGCIDITEDHSLIDINGNKIKPKDCIINKTEIMHSFPEEFKEFDISLEDQGEPYIINTGIIKLCNTCLIEKDENEFYEQNTRKDGSKCLSIKCKLCVKEQACKRKNIPFNGILTERYLKYYVPGYIITKFEAWVMGFFFGDGSCGSYDCDSGHKKSWAINNSNLQFLEKARKYLLAIEPSNVVSDFKVLDTLASSDVYKLVPVGSIKYMVEKYCSLFYDKDDYKKVPKNILNASYEIRLWFMKGYLTADGAKGAMNDGKWNFACKGKIGAQGLFYLMKSVGWKDIRINILDYKENIYFIGNIVDKNYIKNSENKFMKIFELKRDNEDYVYDIETSCGRFQGGVGTIILSNTDSIFQTFPLHKTVDGVQVPLKGKEAIMPSIKMAMEASEAFRKIIKPPHNLEYEKHFYPFILISKKRYCANKYEFDDKKCKQASMGIVLKRRDNAQIVKIIYGGILDIILNEIDIKKSIIFLKKCLNDLIQGKYPLEDLIISKSLKSLYKDPDKIAHKVLADRMGEREEGTAPQVNDRVPYVYIEVDDKKKVLQGNRIEHPDYIRANPKTVKPDYNFYITNQILKPVGQIYALILEDLEGFKKPKDYYKKEYIKILKDKNGDVKKAKDRLYDLREDDVKKILFDDILTKLKNKKAGNREITDFYNII